MVLLNAVGICTGEDGSFFFFLDLDIYNLNGREDDHASYPRILEFQHPNRIVTRFPFPFCCYRAVLSGARLVSVAKGRLATQLHSQHTINSRHCACLAINCFEGLREITAETDRRIFRSYYIRRSIKEAPLQVL